MSEEELVELRNRILEMAREAEAKKDPLIWFEELYESSEGNEEMIPWSNGEPNHLLCRVVGGQSLRKERH